MQLFREPKNINGRVNVVDNVNDIFKNMYKGYPTSSNYIVLRKLV